MKISRMIYKSEPFKDLFWPLRSKLTLEVKSNFCKSCTIKWKTLLKRFDEVIQNGLRFRALNKDLILASEVVKWVIQKIMWTALTFFDVVKRRIATTLAVIPVIPVKQLHTPITQNNRFGGDSYSFCKNEEDNISMISICS